MTPPATDGHVVEEGIYATIVRETVLCVDISQHRQIFVIVMHTHTQTDTKETCAKILKLLPVKLKA